MIAVEVIAEAVRRLSGALPTGSVATEVPLGQRTTYRVGGESAVAATVRTADDLLAVADVVVRLGLDVIVVGRGSNMLVADRGFSGLAVLLDASFGDIEIEGCSVVAGGAAILPVVARRTAAAGLTGFEWAVGVPGTVGGAVRMNAGGHGSDIARTLVRADVIDLKTAEHRWWSSTELDFGYRSSAVKGHQVVVAAELALAEGDRAEAEREIEQIVQWRRANQPGGPNAGSVFTNPSGDSAGRLIDAAGGKGLRVGSAEVSAKHANFIQADPGGRADDVRLLMERVRERVREVHGVDLVAETVLVGFEPREEGQWPR